MAKNHAFIDRQNLSNWYFLKKKIFFHNYRPNFKEREIWWTSIGFNIGDEQYGKNSKYERPVLVLKKFNKNIFYGIPLTGRPKTGEFYYQIYNKDRDVSLMLSQIRLFDAKRLTRKMYMISEGDFENIQKKICEIIKTAPANAEASEPEGVL